MDYVVYGFIYMIGLLTGSVLKSWLVTNEAKNEIEKALDSSGIRRSEFAQLVKLVEINRELIEKIRK